MQDARVFIVRTTNACNLACSYCYMPEKGTTNMPLDLAEQLIDQAVELSGDTLVFIWHGGEPLLMGRRFFEGIIARQSRHDRAFINAVQTNGYGLNDTMAAFFANHGFHVSVSLDMPRARHDACRRTRKDDRPSFERIAGNLDLLRRHGLPVSVLAVVGDLTYPVEEYRAFIDEHRLDSLALNLDFDLALKTDPALGARYTALLDGLYRHAEAAQRPFALREATTVIEHLRHLPVSLCWHSETFCGDNHCAISETGDVYLGCDRFIDGPFDFARLGNLRERPLAEILNAPEALALNRRLAALRVGCTGGCSAAAACRGGCIHEALSIAAAGATRGNQIGCTARRALLDTIRHDFRSESEAPCSATA